jgi:hypothetical protein
VGKAGRLLSVAQHGFYSLLAAANSVRLRIAHFLPPRTAPLPAHDAWHYAKHFFHDRVDMRGFVSLRLSPAGASQVEISFAIDPASREMSLSNRPSDGAYDVSVLCTATAPTDTGRFLRRPPIRRRR